MVLKPVFIPRFKAYYPNTITYQIDASPDLLPERMRARGQSEAEIATRMDVYEQEASEARLFADVVFSNDGVFEKTYSQVRDQICLDKEAYSAVQVI
jgi:dephospho-CoA kinase